MAGQGIENLLCLYLAIAFLVSPHSGDVALLRRAVAARHK